MTPKARTSTSEIRPLLLVATAYLSFLCFLQIGLGFKMLRSDVLTYWNESFKWRTPFSVWWVPGYPLLIAAVRGLTLDLFHPLVVMIGISGVAYLVAVKTVYAFGNTIKLSSPTHLSLLFAFFPFVGLTYSVYPIADSLASAVLLICFLSFQRELWGQFALFAGLSLVTHKVTWFFVPPLMLIGFIRYKSSRRLIPLALVPLLIWIVSGAFYHKDFLWFVHWGVENLVASKGSLPILDGIVSPLLSRSVSATAKGGLVLTVFAASLICLYHSWQRRLWLGLSISLSLLLLAITINSYEIWVVARYSKVLVIPLALLVKPSDLGPRLVSGRYYKGLAITLLLSTNLAFGFYMAKVFFH